MQTQNKGIAFGISDAKHGDNFTLGVITSDISSLQRLIRCACENAESTNFVVRRHKRETPVPCSSFGLTNG